MIGRLSGTLLSKQPPQLMVDVNGVGYEVEAPMSTFYTLPAVGEPVVLVIHMVVREDAQLLYGFSNEQERRLFRTLIKVNGVGAKMALVILSGMSAEEFAQCVDRDDIVGLTRLPGIGKKTAERLIVEMRGKLDAELLASLPDFELTSDDQTSAVSATSLADQATEALAALGYKPAEATRMVKKVGRADSVEEMIRLALKNTLQR